MADSNIHPTAWYEPRTSAPMNEGMSLWWAGTELCRQGQRPDLYTEFLDRWQHWRANGLTKAESADLLAWVESHAVVDFDALTVTAHEPLEPPMQ